MNYPFKVTMKSKVTTLFFFNGILQYLLEMQIMTVLINL